MVDIDNFKRVNDRFGHAVGDAVLIAEAKEIQQLVRQEDILARYGGKAKVFKYFKGLFLLSIIDDEVRNLTFFKREWKIEGFTRDDFYCFLHWAKRFVPDR